MQKVQFTRCAVAFLDVLGFKTFIEAAERDGSPEGLQFAALQKVIARQLDFVQTDAGGNAAIGLDRFPKDIDLRILHVSDSFVLSAPISSERHPTYSGMVAVAIKSVQLAHQLLKMGFLVRGGLAVGNVHRTESNIFGTGYQAAYATEECAGAPRVLFHQSAVEHFETACHLGLPLSSLAIFAREGNDTILDMLVAHWCYVGEDLGADVAEVFRFHKTTIERRLSELPSGSARDKWALVLPHVILLPAASSVMLPEASSRSPLAGLQTARRNTSPPPKASGSARAVCTTIMPMDISAGDGSDMVQLRLLVAFQVRQRPLPVTF